MNEKPEGIRMENALRLTRREHEMLALAARGHTTTEMSQIAWLSQGTVKRHLQMARLKLGAFNTTHAVAIAYEAEILPLKQPSAA